MKTHRLLAIMLFTLIAYGCATQEQKLELYKKQCSEFGWSIESIEHKKCMERLYDSAHW